jgi:hypothetical protein
MVMARPCSPFYRRAVVTITTLRITPTQYSNRIILGEIDGALRQSRYAPIERGFFDVLSHGKPGHALPLVNGEKVPLTAAELVAIIKAYPSYRGEAVRLLMCQAGTGPNSLAQQVATLLVTCVTGPDDEIFAEDLKTVTGIAHSIFWPQRALRD